MKRYVCSMLALAAMLSAASSRAMAQDSQDAPAEQPEAAAPTAAETEEVPRDHAYWIGVGMHGTRVQTTDGTSSGMAGPAITGGYFIGRRMGFLLRGEMSFPVHGQQTLDGVSETYSLRPMYEAFRLNFDAMFLFAYRARPSEKVDVLLGAGLHVQTIRLVSSKYNPIEAITGGIGLLARVERRFGTRFFYGGELAVGVDPLDFVKHQNRIVLTTPMTASFILGIRR